MLLVQQTCYSCQGSINKFLVDDKGMLIVCVFGKSLVPIYQLQLSCISGLPPMKHADDPKRALDAARMLIDLLAKDFPDGDVKCSIGLTTGLYILDRRVML